MNSTKTMDVFAQRDQLVAENARLQARVETLEEVERQLQIANAELREKPCPYVAGHTTRYCTLDGAGELAERYRTALEHALYAWGLVAESESPTEGDREEAAARIRKARAALKGETKGETI